MKPGSLVIVGTDIQLGRHILQHAISDIQHADLLFCMADASCIFIMVTIKTATRPAVKQETLYSMKYMPGKTCAKYFMVILVYLPMSPMR